MQSRGFRIIIQEDNETKDLASAYIVFALYKTLLSVKLSQTCAAAKMSPYFSLGIMQKRGAYVFYE